MPSGVLTVPGRRPGLTYIAEFFESYRILW